MEKPVKSTFNLPEKYAYSGRVVGNGVGIGFHDGTFGFTLSPLNTVTGNGYVTASKDGYGLAVGTRVTANGTVAYGVVSGITTDASKSGVVCEKDTQVMVCIKY